MGYILKGMVPRHPLSRTPECSICLDPVDRHFITKMYCPAGHPDSCPPESSFPDNEEPMFDESWVAACRLRTLSTRLGDYEWRDRKQSIRTSVQLACGHVFHARCLRGWIDSGDKKRCPLCAQVLVKCENVPFDQADPVTDLTDLMEALSAAARVDSNARSQDEDFALVAATADNAARMNALHISFALSALAEMDARPGEEHLTSLIEALVREAPRMTAGQVGSTSIALLSLDARPGPEALATLVAAAVREAPGMNADNVASTSIALLRLDVRPGPEALATLVAAAVRKAPGMNAGQVADTSFGLGKLGARPGPEALATLITAAVREAPAMNADDVALTSFGLGELGARPGREALATLVAAAVREAPRANALEVADTSFGLSRLGARPGPEALATLVAAAVREALGMDPHQIAITISSLGRLGPPRPDSGFLSVLIEAAINEIYRMTPREISLTLKGLARLGARPSPNDLSTLIKATERSVTGMTAAQIASTLSTLPTLGIGPYEPHFAQLPAALVHVASTSTMNAKQISASICGLGKLKLRPNSDELAIILTIALDKAPQMTAQDIHRFFVGMRELIVRPGGDGQDAIFAAIAREASNMDAEQIVNILNAFDELAFNSPPREVVASMVEAVIRESTSMDMHQLSSAMFRLTGMIIECNPRISPHASASKLLEATVGLASRMNARQIVNSLVSLQFFNVHASREDLSTLILAAKRVAPDMSMRDMTITIDHLKQMGAQHDDLAPLLATRGVGGVVRRWLGN